MILNLRHAYYYAETDGAEAGLVREMDPGLREYEAGLKMIDGEGMLPNIENVEAAQMGGGGILGLTTA
jgi:hypothetical protein